MPVSEEVRHELSLLVRSRHPLVLVDTVEERRAVELARLVAEDLGLLLLRWTATDGLRRAEGGGALGHDTRSPGPALRHLARLDREVLVMLLDVQPYLERPEVVRSLRELAHAYGGTRSTALLVGPGLDLPGTLRPSAARLALELPDQERMERLVREVAATLRRTGEGSVELGEEEVSALARALRGLTLEESRRLLLRAGLRDGRLEPGDLHELLEGKRNRLDEGTVLEWVEPAEGLETLAGAAGFKEWVEQRRDAFGAAARGFGLEPPRGVLLAGVPGTGKSLACRALAGAWELPLLALDPGRLYAKYVGETESNLRRALQAVEAMAPAVVWMDEIEKSLAASGGDQDGGVSLRVRGHLLTWLQERSAPVVVAATTNDVGALPPELLRRGRFDEVFFFDLPEAATRRELFALHLRRRDRDPSRFDLDLLARRSEGFSGAEVEAAVVAALYRAFDRRRELDEETLLEELELVRPLSRLRPSVVAELRRWGREHARPA